MEVSLYVLHCGCRGFGDNVTTREQITLPDVAPSVFDDFALGSYGLDGEGVLR